ncbi:YncE family protein [Nocardioides sp.]|uniref:YncE family protein n=1 Tax=Nocardioides sp. TaxID=35761 RepID=UPI003D0FE984
MRRVTPLACALALAATVPGCTGSDDSSTPAPSPTTGAPAQAAATLPVAPGSVVAPASWKLASIEIENPDGLAGLDGAVFVKTDDGRVVRLDASTGKVTAQRKIDTATDIAHYCQGIGSDGETLWACSASDTTTDIVRLDPATLKETGRAKVDKVFDQLSLGVGGGRVWVLTGDGSQLTSVDTRNLEQTTVPLARRCFQTAVTSAVVYATCLLDDEVIAVDTASGEVTDSVSVTQPTNISVTDDEVWVSGSAGLLRLDTELEPQAAYPGLSTGSEGDVVATPSGVWVRHPDEFLLRIDPISGEVAARYAIAPVPSGGSLLVTDDAVWTSAANDATVFKVDRDAS